MMTTISHKTASYLCAAALAFATALPLAAQEAEEAPAAENGAPAAENAAPATPAAPGLSAGTPIETGDNVGRAYTLETQGDWEIRCINAPEGQVDPCSMYQLLKDEDGTEVAEVAIFHVGEDEIEAAATFTTPLETLLTGQLAFFVDGENGRKYPFSFCNRVGCFVRAGLASRDVDLLKRGNEGLIGIVPIGRPEEPVTLKMSLKGFTAAYDRVTEINDAAREGETAGQEPPAE
ncbi:invasion associated locus B family protein [Celeribacter indicus]|uniref:Invasion associated locus B family protein n=1 Tax=Celeribacter indicus TaxID=1208324 RepID=A0A0B5E2U4_9RHOB|nr:invasion associated locus B family protein [Celeribacter indicus]AJE47351.1 invasion associated locus B family protein [Celeribacter indicus]SDW04273.1 Invasion protein IalB, involved in pathogenesis [Celeribacter indicus]